jgi:hypothetical protein
MRPALLGLLVLTLLFACGDETTDDPSGSSSTAGSGGAGGDAGAGGRPPTSVSSAGGSGQGGVGACEPLTSCTEVTAACGMVDAGCGAPPLDCTDPCGSAESAPWLVCGETSGVCECSRAMNFDPQCANPASPAVQAFCNDGGGCQAFFCGNDLEAKDIPSTCIYLANFGEATYCCLGQ